MRMIRLEQLIPISVILFGMMALSSCGGSEAKASEDTKAVTAAPVEETAAVEPAEETVTEDSTASPDAPTESSSADAADTSSNADKTTSSMAERTVNEERLGVILDLISEELEAQKLEYISSKGQDCSGIYHKIKDMVKKKMSVLGDKTKFHYPSFTEDRNSRQIAHWYYKNNNLHIVQDAIADRNLITPGTVVFFGRTEEKYSNITIDLLTNPGKFVHDGTNGKIMHVAVVTKVEKDAAGNVIKYDMMHGRNSRNFASRTTANYDGPGGYGKAYAKFPFGNWNQQLVALAHIETPF